MGVYGVIFPEIKEHGYEKSGIPVHGAYNPKGHLKVKDYHRKTNSCIATMDISKSICAKLHG